MADIDNFVPENVTLELLSFPRGFSEALKLLRPGTRIALATSVNSGGVEAAIDLAVYAAGEGFRVIPRLPARLVQGPRHLDDLLVRATAAGVREFFVVGGDVEQRGDQHYPNSLSLLEAIAVNHPGLVERVGVAGYPSGHSNPTVNNMLMADLQRKQELSRYFPGGMFVETQFDFSYRAVENWIEKIRDENITLPIYVGLFGATSSIDKARLAMEYAGGVLETTKFMKKANINPAAFMKGQYAAQTIKVAEELVAAGADIAGFTVFTLNDVEATLREYGPVFAAARQLRPSIR